MMEIKFDIQQVPAETHGYNVGVYTEGPIEILHAGSSLGPVGDVPLVELAIALDAWLHDSQDNPEDFYYASMNFEEEPLVAFTYDSASESYTVNSALSEAAIAHVPAAVARQGARSYLATLRAQLLNRLGVDITDILREARA